MNPSEGPTPPAPDIPEKQSNPAPTNTTVEVPQSAQPEAAPISPVTPIPPVQTFVPPVVPPQPIVPIPLVRPVTPPVATIPITPPTPPKTVPASTAQTTPLAAPPPVVKSVPPPAVPEGPSPIIPSTTPVTPPIPAPIPPITRTPQTPSPQSAAVPRLRTLRLDAEQSIKSGTTTVVSAAALSERARQAKAAEAAAPQAQPSVERPRIKLTTGRIILIGIVATLFAWGIEAVLYFNFFAPEKPATTAQQTVVNKPSAIIYSEEEKAVVLDVSLSDAQRKLTASIQNELTRPPRLGAVRTLVPIRAAGTAEAEAVGAVEFMSAVAPHVPATLARTLQPNFVWGVYTYDGTHPFLILKTTSYEQAFAGMLAWERDLASDASNFLPAVSNMVATTSPSAPIWQDAVVKNKDARALKAENGSYDILYSFVNKETIVLTTDEDTFAEVVRRLGTTQTVR